MMEKEADRRRELKPGEEIRGEYLYAKIGGVSMVLGRAADIIAGHGEVPEQLVQNVRRSEARPAPTNLDSYAVYREIGFTDGVELAKEEIAYHTDNPTVGDKQRERVEALEGAVSHTEREREISKLNNDIEAWQL